ncbi:MAG: hypothetical protein D4R64_08465 [Porphyromonadaceae bacterium]|nr:MAG: hypothetical protein D4R64_08465 [Porphyromonadaceae bacterium]
MNRVDKEESIVSMKSGLGINETKQIQESVDILDINEPDQVFVFWDVYHKTRSRFLVTNMWLPVLIIVQALFFSYFLVPATLREKIAANGKFFQFFLFALSLSVIILLCWGVTIIRLRKWSARTKLVDKIAVAYQLGIYTPKIST